MNKILVNFLAGTVLLLPGCTNRAEYPHLDHNAVKLLSKMEVSATEGKIMYGHQDDLMYGHTWRAGEEATLGRSDVKEVCGDYPAVLGMDLGGIELQNERNLDGCLFSHIRDAAVSHYEKGGIVTFSWHIANPLTRGDSWDISSKETVSSILESGAKHEQFRQWLSRCADFLSSLKDSSGETVPVIFRPWHEHTGSWFWWGKDLCSVEQYKALWTMTFDYMTKERGLKNLIWSYSPGAGTDASGYMERYPGDSMVDMLGLDCYQYGELPESNRAYAKQLDETLSFISLIGKEHSKPVALTETGLESIAEPKWWTEVLYPVIEKYSMVYVLTWRNAWDRPEHYYAPWPGSPDESDFKDFYALPRTVFLSELNN